jgi:acetylornithine deacetylase/succinyl-diaminopimelate desuccinylase-like protein
MVDHVDPGDAAAWPSYGQPYSGAIYEGKVWGRGASDIKGALAAQVHGVARVIAADQRPAGDVYVTGTVQEEVGGVGARLMAQQLRDKVQLAIVGEPSSNELRRGHRGRSELLVHIKGRSVHASVPETGVNPLFVLANFLQKMPELSMAHHNDLGYSSVAATLIRTDQKSSNVTPGELWLTLDWRHVPGEKTVDAKALLEPLLAASLIKATSGEIIIPLFDFVSYTGYAKSLPAAMPAYSLAANDPALQSAERLLSKALARPIPTKFWNFATDGSHFSEAGMTVIGFAPGNEALAHTVNEHIELAEWQEAMVANKWLAQKWARETDNLARKVVSGSKI